MSQLKPPVGVGDHMLGDAKAPVTLVEYGDYECPHCGAAHPIVKAALQRVGKDVRFVFRNFPLSEAHPHAFRAAEASEAAATQGEFWPMHDLLFENQDALTAGDLGEYAKRLGLDAHRFTSELRDGTHAAKVRGDFASGVRSGVNGTPTFFVQGTRLDGPWDLDSLVAALRGAMRAKP